MRSPPTVARGHRVKTKLTGEAGPSKPTPPRLRGTLKERMVISLNQVLDWVKNEEAEEEAELKKELDEAKKSMMSMHRQWTAVEEQYRKEKMENEGIRAQW